MTQSVHTQNGRESFERTTAFSAVHLQAQRLPHVPWPIPVHENFRIIAHRGASAYAPENTYSAFDLALKLNATEIELDAQLTKDNQIVILHDDTLERYGYGSVSARDRTLSELQALDMGTWHHPTFSGEQIVSLRGLFERYGDQFTYHIELKDTQRDTPRAVVSLVEEFGLSANTIITSGHFDQLLRVRALDATKRLGWLVKELSADLLSTAGAIGLYQLCPSAESITTPLVLAAKKMVPEVRVWGLQGENPETVYSLLRSVLHTGCDGATINWPDWLTRVTPEKVSANG